MAVPRLSLEQLNRATLARQGLLDPLSATTIADAVEQVGSLQAQHPDWPAIALGTRLPPHGAHGDLASSLARRDVVRASLMRMTVHVVSAADYWPMRAVSTDFRLAQWRTLYKLDPATSPLGRRILAAHPAVIAAMAHGPLAIHEIETILKAELGPGVEIPPYRCLWRHFTAFVGLVHVPHEGEAYGRSRYLPAEAWIGGAGEGLDDPETAALKVADRYLGAFGPASIDDLAAYVGRGRNVGRWRNAMVRLEPRLVHFTDAAGRPVVDLADAPRPPDHSPAAPRLLARWDSLLLAYGTRDRTRVLADAHRGTVITKNADVLPTFLVGGWVAGTWLPRQSPAGERYAELRPFTRLDSADRAVLEDDAQRLLVGVGAGVFSRYPGTD